MFLLKRYIHPDPRFSADFRPCPHNDFAPGLRWNRQSNPPTTFRNPGSITEWRLSSVHAPVTCEQVLTSKGQSSRLRSHTATVYKLGERAFSFCGPASWNSLPTDLYTVSVSTGFKNQLKTRLYEISFVIQYMLLLISVFLSVYLIIYTFFNVFST